MAGRAHRHFHLYNNGVKMNLPSNRHAIVLRFWFEQQQDSPVWHCEVVNVQTDERAFAANLSMLNGILGDWLKRWMQAEVEQREDEEHK